MASAYMTTPASTSTPGGVVVRTPTITYGIDFKNMPPEIRNRIYRFAFVKADYIGSCSRGVTLAAKEFHAEVTVYRNINFLLSCKLVYDESTDVFYACNGFEFQKVGVLGEFLASIGIENRKKIRKLRLLHFLPLQATWALGAGQTAHKALRYLRSCSELKSLEIYACCRPTGSTRLWLAYPFEDALGFLQSKHGAFKYGDPQAGGDTAAIEALLNVREEQNGRRFPHLPNIFSGQPRAWRFNDYRKKVEDAQIPGEGIMDPLQTDQPGPSSSVLESSSEEPQSSLDEGQDSHVHAENANLVKSDEPSSSSSVFASSTGVLGVQSDQMNGADLQEEHASLIGLEPASSLSTAHASNTAGIQTQAATGGYHHGTNDDLEDDNVE